MATRAASTSTKSTAPATPPETGTPPAQTDSTHAQLEVVHLPVSELRPNPWNPNRMSLEMMHKLREYIRKEGLVEPLIVRRLPDHCQILGGYHRWCICKDELGYTTVPCVVVDMDDRRAKILTVNLNEMSGDPVPHLLAELIHDLNRETSLEDLQTMLPYELPELKDSLELLKLPDGLAQMVAEQAEKEAKEAPTVLTFVVDDAEVVERTIDAIAADIEGKNRRGRALVVLANEYLEQSRPGCAAGKLPKAGPDANPQREGRRAGG